MLSECNFAPLAKSKNNFLAGIRNQGTMEDKL